MGLGIEIEFTRAIQDASGGKIPGDTKILKLPLLCHLVSDSRSRPKPAKGSYSNMEIVTFHFDQHAGSEDEAQAVLDERLDILNALRDDLYRSDTDQWLRDLVTVTTKKLHGDFVAKRVQAHQVAAYVPTLLVDAKVTPASEPVADDQTLLVHYTVGFPPESLGAAITWIAGQTRRAPDNHRVEHATKASTIADQVIAGPLDKRVDPAWRAELHGFLALVFIHVAAFADIAANVDDDGHSGKPKNTIAALSRVPLGNVYQELRDGARQLLHEKREAIHDVMCEAIIPSFSDDDERKIGKLEPVTIHQYAMAAYGEGDVVDQERVFGGMNETPVDPRVHGATDPDAVLGRGIPLELRSIGARSPRWNAFHTYTKDLLTWSRTMALPNPKGPHPA